VTPTINDIVLFHSRLRPEAPAIFHRRGVVTYRQFVRDIGRLASELNAQKIGPGPVAVVYQRNYLHLLLWFALERLGIASVSLRQVQSPIPWELTEPLCVVSPTAPSGTDRRWIHIGEDWPQSSDVAEFSGSAQPSAEALVHIVLSSGSTGLPKAIPVTRRVQMARIEEHVRDFGLTQHSRFITAHPMSNGPCYWTMLATLSVGGMVILPGGVEQFLLSAELFLATHLSCSPHALAELLKGGGSSSPLTSLQRLDVAGSLLPRKVADEAQRRFTPNLFLTYGSTEAGRTAFGRAGPLEGLEGAVGHVSPWVDVEIVDEDNIPVSRGREGRLRVRSPGLIDEYYRDLRATTASFHDGWFYPGDLCVLEESGVLRVLGRVDDVINTGGDKISAVAAEEKLRSVAGVSDVAVFAVTEPDGAVRVWAAVVGGEGLNKASLTEVAQQARVARVMHAKTLPRNENGKVLLHVLREQAGRSFSADASRGLAN
jgi:2,3-dihydroxybenzoate-AMP ligase